MWCLGWRGVWQQHMLGWYKERNSQLCQGGVNYYNLEKNLALYWEFKICLCYDPEISLLAVFPREILTHIHLYTCIKFTGALQQHTVNSSLWENRFLNHPAIAWFWFRHSKAETLALLLVFCILDSFLCCGDISLIFKCAYVLLVFYFYILFIVAVFIST